VAGFSTHKGKIAVLPGDDVDTDRIIPARFLSRVSRSGYGELLFHDVRGPEFPLDREEAKGASVLIVGSNFGCGSSREHAVWAIQQAGFKAVIARKTDSAQGFSDIFRQNAANCGLLLIELSSKLHDNLAGAGSGAQAEIDLERQTISVAGEGILFDIHPALKESLLKGLDLIGTTLLFEDAIAKYERADPTFVPPKREGVAS
jgi:3-isopropylmalate/(R)-2-methylmalate dehydratase small subunit